MIESPNPPLWETIASGPGCSERAIRLRDDVHRADAIRAHDPHAALRDGGVELALHIGAGIAHFTEARRQDDREWNARLTALFERIGHVDRGNGDHGNVAGARKLPHLRIGFHALHFHTVRVHGIKLPRVTGREHVMQRLPADRVCVGRRADERDSGRLEQAREIRTAHVRERASAEVRTGWMTVTSARARESREYYTF
jgi:hypothetical protein